MANKPLNTRIQLKHDTEAHWILAKNFTPLAGELIIYEADEEHDAPRLKIGDGVTKVNDLPFSLGDGDITETDPTVPTWAKAVTKPSYTAGEVGALPDTTVIPEKTSQLTNDSGFITTHRPIQVNGTQILGNNTTALNLKAGSNISLSNTAGTVTINATDTTYSSKNAKEGGTEVSLVTTGEKATWNAKTSNVGTITGITMNGTSKGTSGVVDLGTVITSHQDISGKVSGPASATNNAVAIFDGTTGKTIKNSGFTINKSVPSDAIFTDTNYYHTTGSWGGTNSLTYTATANGGAGTLAFTLPTASTSAYGVTKLNNTVNSTSTALAATANSVKTAYDLANKGGAHYVYTTSNSFTSDALTYGTAIIPINGQVIFIILSKATAGAANMTIKFGSNSAISIVNSLNNAIKAIYPVGTILQLVYANSKFYLLNLTTAL